MKILPVLLIVAGLALGIFGYTKLDDSSASISIGDAEISATDEGGRTEAYVIMGLGVVCLVIGAGMMRGAK
jgi:hypothetical protein